MSSLAMIVGSAYHELVVELRAENARLQSALSEAERVAFEMIDAEQSLRNNCAQGTADRAIHDYAAETAGQIYRAIRSIHKGKQ